MYPSDLTDGQWARLEALLEEPVGNRHAGGRPRKHSLRRVTDAVLYVVKTGCRWRQLPANFPPWQTVYRRFRAWRMRGTWERVTRALREQQRKAQGRNLAPTAAIVDSQTAKTALKGGGAGRVDGCRGDFCLFARIEIVFADGGYTGTPSDWAKSAAADLAYTVEVVKRTELHRFKVLPKRWGRGTNLCVVELVPPPRQGLRTAPHRLRNHGLDCLRSSAAEMLCVVFKQETTTMTC